MAVLVADNLAKHLRKKPKTWRQPTLSQELKYSITAADGTALILNQINYTGVTCPRKGQLSLQLPSLVLHDETRKPGTTIEAV